jgi:hypothetical protein
LSIDDTDLKRYVKEGMTQSLLMIQVQGMEQSPDSVSIGMKWTALGAYTALMKVGKHFAGLTAREVAEIRAATPVEVDLDAELRKLTDEEG